MKSVELSRLLQTTAFRIAWRYALIYALLAAAVLAVFYWATSVYVDEQLKKGLLEDFQSLGHRHQAAGLEGLTALVNARSEAGLEEGRFYLLVDNQGKWLAGNLQGLPPEDPVPLDGNIHVVWVEDDIIPIASYTDDAYWPVIGRSFSDGSQLMVARSVGQAEAMQSYSLYALVALFIIIVSLALAMGLFIGVGILRRIDSISSTASSIMAGDLQQRMPVSQRNDEFDQLSRQLNNMLVRIEELIEGIRQVSDNVAHDLRSPLTRIRNRLEVTLLEQRASEDYRLAMEQSIQDADALIRTFNAILQIARADAGHTRAVMSTVDLGRLIRELGDLYRPLIEERQHRLVVTAEQKIMVTCDKDLVAQAISNLLDNAIKYTTDNGLIELKAEVRERMACVSVADNGPGIPDTDRKRVIERFTRLDQARSTEGNGLGLSIVDSIARQHRARLVLKDNKPGLLAEICFSQLN